MAYFSNGGYVREWQKLILLVVVDSTFLFEGGGETELCRASALRFNE